MSEASIRDGSATSTRHGSYAQILRSSVLIGGAAALTLAIGMVRIKALALLIGPAGIGLLGVFSSIFELARSVAQVGISASGVRQIAEAVASEDVQRIARTVTVVRRAAFGLGLLGTLGLAVLAREVSYSTFGSTEHAESIAWLSLAVFFRLVADAQACLFQGLRRIADLAQIGVFGALAGAVASIILAAALGEAGVVPGLVAAAAVSTLISWRYASALKVESAPMTGAQFRDEAAALLKLGLAFMGSALLMAGAAFAVRAIVLRQIGVDAAGLYHAAWTLGGMYVGFILQAMGTDFYPRLVGVIKAPQECTRVVNEQAGVSLLLAGPGVIATLVFAAPVLTAFYSADFAAAESTLRWFCLGMALRVISWPMGYIIVARNQRLVFFSTELAWTVVNVGLSWACIERFGLVGAGMAFFGSYVFHGLMVYAVVRRTQGFRWSAATWRQGSIFVAIIAGTFAADSLLPAAWARGAEVALLFASVAYTLRSLSQLAPELVPHALKRLLARKIQVSKAPTHEQ